MPAVQAYYCHLVVKGLHCFTCVHPLPDGLDSDFLISLTCTATHEPQGSACPAAIPRKSSHQDSSFRVFCPPLVPSFQGILGTPDP